MTKRTKQILSVLLAVLMMVSVLAACGDKDSGSSQQSSSTSTGESKTESDDESEPSETGNDAPGEVVTLNIWGMTNSATNPDTDLVAEAISEITREKIGVEVKMTRSGDGEKLNLALTSGEKLDLVNFHTYSGGLPTLVSAGYATPLDDLVAQHGAKIPDVVPETFLECGRINGILYTIPSLKDTTRGAGFAMRKDILDELKIDVSTINTWDDVHDVFVKVKEEKPDMWPLVPSWANGGMQETICYDDLGGGQGVLVNFPDKPDDLTVVNLYATEEYKEFCQRMYKWKQEGLIYPDATTTTEGNLMSTVGFADYENIKPGKDLECKKGWGVDVELVQLMEPITFTGAAGNSSLFIPSVSEYPEKAMELWELMFTDPEISNLFINGIEGKHWEYTDDSKTFISVPDGVDITASGYETLDWAWPNMRITPVWEGGDADLWEQMNNFDAQADVSPAMGFRFDNTNVMNEITACSNVVTKYNNGLRWGELNPEEALPEFLSEMEAAGVNTIIEEKQKQLDAWANSK